MRKIVPVVSWSAALCIDSLPCPLLLSWPLDGGVVARKLGHPLSANSINIFSTRLSHTPCGLTSFKECHFFSEPGPKNDQCPVPNFLAQKDTSRAFARHSFSLSFVPQEMSPNIDMNGILPVKFSGVSPNLLSKLLTNPILGRCSTRISSALHRFCQSFCSFEKFVIHPILSSHASLDSGFSKIFPSTTQNPKKT